MESDVITCISQLKQIVDDKDFPKKIRSTGFSLEECCHLYCVTDPIFHKLVKDIKEEVGYEGEEFIFSGYFSKNALMYDINRFIKYVEDASLELKSQ